MQQKDLLLCFGFDSHSNASEKANGRGSSREEGGGGGTSRDWVSVEAVDLRGKSNKMCPFIAFTPTTTNNNRVACLATYWLEN